MDQICTLPELRTMLLTASTFAKAHVAFVVIPVTSRAEFVELTASAAEKMLALANEIEQPAPVMERPTPVTKPYRCGTCGSNDLQRYQRCQHAGCPDGRDR